MFIYNFYGWLILPPDFFLRACLKFDRVGGNLEAIYMTIRIANGRNNFVDVQILHAFFYMVVWILDTIFPHDCLDYCVVIYSLCIQVHSPSSILFL
jgi:hypothetical protein